MNSNEKQAILKEELRDKIENFFEMISADKERLYVFSTKGIGDFIISGGLSYAVQKRKNKKSTVLVVQHAKKNTGLLFPNVTGILSIDESVVGTLNEYFDATGNYEGDNYIFANIRKGNGEYVWDLSLNMLDRFKKDALKIPLDSPFVYPIIDEVSEENANALKEKYILDKERTIILLPHAKTFKKLPENFWVTMAKRLKEKNYIVYTNVADDEKSIEGTEPIKVNFIELNFITDKVKCFIGLNSGVFIFLAMTDAKLFNITHFPHWYWDISILFPDCDNRTFYDTTNYTSKIRNIFKMYDLSVNINYAHKKVATENIFNSRTDMLEAILNEVEKI